MAAGLRVRIEGDEEVLRGIVKMNPARPEINRSFLLQAAAKVMRTAQQQTIKRGGGGEPVKGVLTSRSGTLRRSLGGATAIDSAGLPHFVEAGSDTVYARIHELGGLAGRKSSRVRIPARPYLAPALEIAARQFVDDYAAIWNRAQ